MPKHIVIIGGGFGGINVAKSLRDTDYKITIIDKSNHHLFQPLLYQVATAALSPGDIAVPIRFIFSKQNNVHVILGEVVAVSKEDQIVQLAEGDVIPFDYLIRV
jgi:NADH dehydrogenase